MELMHPRAPIETLCAVDESTTADQNIRAELSWCDGQDFKNGRDVTTTKLGCENDDQITDKIKVFHKMSSDSGINEETVEKNNQTSSSSTPPSSVFEQNARLRNNLAQVIDANRKWRKYNEDRQNYVQKLLERIKELEDKVERRLESDAADDDDRRSRDRLSTTSPPPPSKNVVVVVDKFADKNDYLNLQLSHENSVKTNCSLQRRIDEDQSKIEGLTEQIRKMENDHRNLVKLLEVELRTHKEDWQTERDEKEKSQRRCEHLNDELMALKRKYKECDSKLNAVQSILRENSSSADRKLTRHSSLKSQSSSHKSSSSSPLHVAAAINNLRTSSFNHNHKMSCCNKDSGKKDGETSNIPNMRHLIDDGNSEKNEEEMRVGSSEISKTQSVTAIGMTEDDSLECPSCGRRFIVNEHHRLLKHFNECQNKNVTN